MKYAYIRVSTVEQAESGLSLRTQEKVCRRLYKQIDDSIGPHAFPVTSHDGFFVDVTSSWRKAFANRPAGSALVKVLQPGDTICIARLDRAFRNVADFCDFVKLASKNLWNVVCADPVVDLGTPYGRLMATACAMMAQFESDMKSMRTKEALAIKRATGSVPKPKSERKSQAESEYRPKKQLQPVSGLPSGRAFVYVRCSHLSSAESGLGMRAQANACCEYAENLAEMNPNLEWSDCDEFVVADCAVSAYKIPLFKRPEGKRLNSLLKKGDVVICLRPDRMFASTLDMANTMKEWNERGVAVHFVETGLSSNDPSGQLLLTVLVAFSQFERAMIGARCREIRATLEQAGSYTGGRSGGYPPFWRQVEIGDAKVMVLDAAQIAAFRCINMIIRRTGCTIRAALARFEELLAKRENRPAIPEYGVSRRGKFASLPDRFIPTDTGQIFPVWTKRRYGYYKQHWEETIRLWYGKSPGERRHLRLFAKEDGYRRHTSMKRETVDRRQRAGRIGAT